MNSFTDIYNKESSGAFLYGYAVVALLLPNIALCYTEIGITNKGETSAFEFLVQLVEHDVALKYKFEQTKPLSSGLRSLL